MDANLPASPANNHEKQYAQYPLCLAALWLRCRYRDACGCHGCRCTAARGSYALRLPAVPAELRVIRLFHPALRTIHRYSLPNARVFSVKLILAEKFFEVLGDCFSHRLFVFASASLFVDGIRPKHLAGTGLDQLNRDVPLVLNPSTIGE